MHSKLNCSIVKAYKNTIKTRVHTQQFQIDIKFMKNMKTHFHASSIARKGNCIMLRNRTKIYFFATFSPFSGFSQNKHNLVEKWFYYLEQLNKQK